MAVSFILPLKAQGLHQQLTPMRARRIAATRGEMAKYSGLKIPGFVSTMLYRMDRNANDCYLAVAFKDKESYLANARDPKQDERYQRMRTLLAADPEWHDGAIVWSEKA